MILAILKRLEIGIISKNYLGLPVVMQTADYGLRQGVDVHSIDVITRSRDRLVGDEVALLLRRSARGTATRRDATRRDATRRDATRRDATRRDATRRDATQRNATTLGREDADLDEVVARAVH